MQEREEGIEILLLARMFGKEGNASLMAIQLVMVALVRLTYRL